MVPFAREEKNGSITDAGPGQAWLGQGRHGWAAQALNPDVTQMSGHLINLLRTPSIYGGASRAGVLQRPATPLGRGSDQDHRPSNRPLKDPSRPLKDPSRPLTDPSRPLTEPSKTGGTPQNPQKHLAIGHQILRSPRMRPTPQFGGVRGRFRGWFRGWRPLHNPTREG